MQQTTPRAAAESRAVLVFRVAVVLALGIVLLARALQPGGFYVSERETQTAINADYMVREGHGPFDAITPVMGYPWRVPMEFPLYQWIVARLSTGWVGLADTGRLASLACWALGLWAAARAMHGAGIERGRRHAFLALAVTSPLFLAYGFSFTIETTALALAAWYLERWLAFERSGRVGSWAAALVLGALAAAVKGTTWVVFAAAVGLAVAATTLASLRRRRPEWRATLLHGALLLLPLAVGLVWTRYADAVKSQNAIASLVTSAALDAWNYGTFAQKLSVTGWLHYLGRSTVLLLGVLGLAILPAMAVLAWRRRGAYDGRLVALCLATFLAGPLVFTNLHFEHDYYAMAGGWFLLGTFVLLPRRAPSATVLLLLVLSNAATGFVYLQLKQANYRDPATTHVVRAVRELPPGTTLVVLGAFFDSYIPYYSGLKALQVPREDPRDPVFRTALERMGDRNVGAAIAKSARFHDIAAATARELGLHESFDLAPGVRIHYRTELRPYLRLEHLDTEALARREVAPFIQQFDGAPPRLQLSLSGETGVSAALVAGGNLYLFDLRRGFRVIHHRWYGGDVRALLAPG